MKHIIFFFLVINFQLQAQQILLKPKRAEVVDNILEDRFNNLLPKLMDDTGLDM